MTSATDLRRRMAIIMAGLLLSSGGCRLPMRQRTAVVPAKPTPTHPQSQAQAQAQGAQPPAFDPEASLHPAQVSTPMPAGNTVSPGMESGDLAQTDPREVESAAQVPVPAVPQPIGMDAIVRRDAFQGARLGRVLLAGADPKGGGGGDEHPASHSHVFTLRRGNELGLFEIEPRTGWIRLANAGAFRTNPTSLYELEVQVEAEADTNSNTNADAGADANVDAKDTASNDRAPAAAATAQVRIHAVPAGYVADSPPQQEIWSNVGGGPTEVGLAAHPQFPGAPEALRPMNGFATAGDGMGEGFASRIRAYVTPPETGFYTFFLASEGPSELWSGAGSESANPGLIAAVEQPTAREEWSRWPSQQSAPEWLVAGELHYLETRHRQVGPRGHVEVGWIGPGFDSTNVIASDYLLPVDLGHAPTLTLPTGRVMVSSAATNGTRVATIAAADSPLDRLTFRMLSGNDRGAFELDPVSGELRVANRSALDLAGPASIPLEVQVQDSGYDGLFPLRSAKSTLTVHVVAPAIANAAQDLEDSLTGPRGFIKSGQGRLVIRTPQLHEGPTRIEAGTLALTEEGALPLSPVIEIEQSAVLEVGGVREGFTIARGQTLRGDGAIAGPVTIQGRLVSGDTASGESLTFAHSLALAGELELHVQRARASEPAPRLQVLEDLQLGGRLVVKSPERSTLLGAGDQFQLFNAAQVSGSFAEVELPALRSGLQWDTRTLATDGTIRVAATAPRILSMCVSGDTVSIRVQSIARARYVVESTSDLGPTGLWTAVHEQEGIDGLMTLAFPASFSTEVQRFLRLRVVLPAAQF